MNVTDFVDEQHFSWYIATFMERFGHYYDNIDYNHKHPRPRDCYEYCSKIERDISEKESNGYALHGELSWLQEYCTMCDDESKLFPVVFAAWYGFSEKECCLIGDQKYPDLAAYILNAFLCGKPCDEICHILQMNGKTEEEKREMLSVDYEGEAYIYHEGEEIPIWKEGGWLTNLKTGNKFKLGDFIV